MAAPFSNFRKNSPQTRGVHPKSPRFSTPRQGVMPLVKRMPGPLQQKRGGYSSFCSVCNVKLNSEFQTREHYSGRTHLNNTSILGLTPDQPNPSNSVNSALSSFCWICKVVLNSEFETREHYSGKTHLSNMSVLGLTPDKKGYSTFCSVCKIKLNSEFQTRKHYIGKTHLNNTSLLDLTPDQPNPSNSGFKPPAEPVMRSATDSGNPSDTKKPKLSPSVSGVQGKNHLALLLEYRPGLEFVMKSQTGKNNTMLFTATVEIDGKKYDASAPDKKVAQQSVASVVYAYIGSHIEEVLTQRAADETAQQVISDVRKAEEPKKNPEDFTSLDDICNCVSFSCFSGDVSTFAAGISGSDESDIKPANISGNDPSGNGTSLKSDISGGDGATGSVSSTTTDNSAVPGSGDAKAPDASPVVTDVKLPRSSTAILNFVRPGTMRTLSKEPSLIDPLCEEWVVTYVVDGETFKGRARAKNYATACAAEEVLKKLFGMTFEKSERGIAKFTGDTSEIIKARETMQPPANDVSALELVDGKSPVVLLNDIFHGKEVYCFHPQMMSQWGVEHRCSVTVGGMTIEGQDVTQKAAKNRAALAAVAALKASGMFARMVTEAKARRAGVPIQQVLKGEVAIPLNPTDRLDSLFPGSKYEPQGKVIDSNGKKMYMVTVKVGEKVFTGTGSPRPFARDKAAENALRSLGLWTKEDQESKRRMIAHWKAEIRLRAKIVSRNARKGLTDGARGQALRGQARGRITRRAGHVTRGLGRGIVAQGQRRGTETRGQRRASVARGRGVRTRGSGSILAIGGGTQGRGSGSILATGGSYYDASGSAFSTGLGHGGLSTLRGTNSRVNFIGCKPRGRSGGNGNVSANLLKMAHGSNYDVADPGYDITSNEAMDSCYDTTSNVATYESTYDSSSYDPPTNPTATSTLGFYGNPTDSAFYSIPGPSRGHAKASRRPLRSRGLAASHTTPYVVHDEVTSMSYTQISNEDGSSFGVTTQNIRGARGTRAIPRRRALRSRGSVGRGALQSPLPATYGSNVSQEYTYGNAYPGYEELLQDQTYSSYSDSSAAMELCYPNDELQYPNDTGYDASSW